MSAIITSINVNPNGGVPKLPVESARITFTQVEGDLQRNLKFHGGPLRAVCLYSQERINQLQSEKHPITPGSVGENITISGLDWEQLTPGTTLKIGNQVILQVTTYTEPCRTIRMSFKDQDFQRIKQDLHPGWSRVYTKVITEGQVVVGDDVLII